jgi:RNA-directed DNA polymerase
MNANGESDGRVVPTNPANNGEAESPAESAEGRRPAKRNTDQSNLSRTPSRIKRRSSGLTGVREAARKDRSLKFTALLHHIDVDLLTTSFYQLKRNAALGIDGVSWHEYEQDLENRLIDLHGRIHRGAFRAKASRRVYIDKPGGKKRPLGIPSIEDKIVQHAVRMVLQSIYEQDFLGFSYGFRPGRSQHQALDSLYVAITEKRVNWVLDADIEGFFDQIDRDWLIKFIEHRVGDKRIVRLIQKWLNAGIVEETDWSDSGAGTPQGAILSPLLANIFLHYVFDRWINAWRRTHARGEVIVVRYADDFVIGFEREEDARACLNALGVRLGNFGLNLHPDKTRLIEFGRGSMARREREGRGKCETFDFLGFTHICGRPRKSRRFIVIRRTMASRMRRTLAAIQSQLVRRRHDPIGKTGRWLARVVRGWQGYHGVPLNFKRLQQFREAILHLWLRQLRSRSQRGRRGWTYARMGRLVRKHLPPPKITHPWPATRHRVRLEAGAV